MQEQQQFTHLNSALINNLNSSDAAEKLAVLVCQHAQVTEKLRGLSHDQIFDELPDNCVWHELENQVACLRFEMENFKLAFAPTSKPALIFSDYENSAEFLFVE